MGTYAAREKTNFHEVFIDEIENLVIILEFKGL